MILLFLGLGYIFAMIQIFAVHADRDGKPGLSVRDLQIAYRGSREMTRLEAAVTGPMSGMLSEQEAAKIIAWIHGGATKEEYDREVKPITESRCIMCHNPDNPPRAELTGYDQIIKLAETDTGVSIDALVSVSHIHLFGLTFIFSLLGLVFSHSVVKWRYLKSILIVIPFATIFLDIASWWLTKVSEFFAYTVLLGGALMGISFACQWLISFYQMWFMKEPAGEQEIH
jgi:hypothetical protein